ncbi:hypothetical protein [Silvimonas amylolytica]|uniref:Uncharacterized protein n=1 Tax=Silvimonas amylolytica TaxID=449663 RepID=A0ABQ2PRR4_9NEIS|nr:hypothetical protein [Silvimonas amylolytica]GGP28165.1 hypothetical protein GCM10010971_39840 [Silvimonas amylolytica]
MHVDQARQSLASSLAMLYQEQFSGTWQPDSTSNSGTPSAGSSDSSGDSTAAPSPSTDVQLSQAGQQAASASQTGSQNGLASQISPEVDIFRSMMEQMLGTSITGMQFTGQLAEGTQIGISGGASGHHGHGSNSSSGSNGNLYAAFGMALNLSGTITTADGRTLGFTASMTLLEAESWSGGTNAHASNPDSGHQLPSLPAPTPAPSTSGSGTPTSSSSGNSGVPSVNVPIPSASPAPAPTPTTSSPTPAPTSTAPTPTPAPTSSTPAPAPTSGSSTGNGQNDWLGSLLQFESSAVSFLVNLNDTLFKQMSDWLSALNGATVTTSNAGSGDTSGHTGTTGNNADTGVGSTSTATDASGTTSVTITDENGLHQLGTGTSLTNYTPTPASSSKVGDTYSGSSPTPSSVSVSA